MYREKSLESFRKDFPSLKQFRNSKPPVYFDNACTTLVPQSVIETINEYYIKYPGCGGSRSRHWFAGEVVRRIEGEPQNKILGSRQIIQKFINAKSEKEIIFTYNTSHAINTVALGYKFHPQDVVLLTDKEHNSNLVPWLRLQKKGIVKVDHVEPLVDDTFDLETFKHKLKNNRVSLVSMAFTSNLTGYTIPAKEIIQIAHEHGAKVLLDAAQAVPHRSVDVQDLDVDFLAFSLHKMCGPRGLGILYGKKEYLGGKPHEEDDSGSIIEPIALGGDTVNETTYNSYSLAEPPARFEIGVQNYAAQIASGTVVKYLQQIGMNHIERHEKKLNNYLTEHLLARYGDLGWFRILGPQKAEQRSGILTFEVKRPNAVGIAEELDARSNVMIRDGVFCAHSYFNQQFGLNWYRPRLPSEHRMLYRVSVYFYNTLEECRLFLEVLNQIFIERGYLEF
jgi:cysteine desulfurase / selenocysteine lyase